MPNLTFFSHLHTIPILIESYLILKILLAFALGSVVGWERQKEGKAAGIRTFGFICGASCVVSILSLMVQDADPARMISYISIGIGFISGAIIYLHKDQDSHVHGITTAASLWVISGIGILVALKLYLLAIASTLMTLIVLKLTFWPFWSTISKKRKRIA